MQQLGLLDVLAVPALHHHPRQAIAQLEELIASSVAPTLVGSSLGGYYATYLAESYQLKALLINPSVLPHQHLGALYQNLQTNFYTGETWQPTPDHLVALSELAVAPPTGERFMVWLETGDSVLDYREAATYYQDCILDIIQGGDHSFQAFVQKLPELLAFAGITTRV